MRKYRWPLYLFLLFLFSCDFLESPFTLTKKEHRLIYVAKHKVDCVGEGGMSCLLIKERPEEEWRYFYGPIEGFDHEEGYEYAIEVYVEQVGNPPEDGSSLKYTLVKILSKK